MDRTAASMSSLNGSHDLLHPRAPRLTQRGAARQFGQAKPDRSADQTDHGHHRDPYHTERIFTAADLQRILEEQLSTWRAMGDSDPHIKLPPPRWRPSDRFINDAKVIWVKAAPYVFWFAVAMAISVAVFRRVF